MTQQEARQQDLRLFRIWLKSAKTVYNLMVEDVKSYGLTPENFTVLELLYNKGPQYIQTISEKLMIPSGSITYVVNKLEKMKLVMKEQDTNNRRYWKVALTEDGETLFNEIFPDHLETIEQIMSPLDQEEKQQLAELLKTVGLNATEIK